jgi:predicted amidohydrolase YtcJ
LDLILRNGKIVTMDDGGSIVEAMAVRDGRIVATGADHQIAGLAKSDTTVVDLAGKTVLPGLIDVHTHALEWAKGVVRGQINGGARSMRSVADLVAAVKERATKLAPGEWIVGAGWDDSKLAEHRYVRAADLDPVSPHNPVFLDHVSGHLAVINTAAMKLTGVTRATPDPEGGVIEHDASGEPTGIVKDTAMLPVMAKIPLDPPDLAMRAAEYVSRSALALGLTTVHNIWLTPDDIRGYQQAYGRGLLKARILMSPGVNNLAETEELLKTGVHTGFGDDQLKFGLVKIFTDGGMGARTIAIYPPGVIGEPDNIGVLRWTSTDLQKAHLMLARGGWQLGTHAIGDRAIDQVLDSYQYVTKMLGLKDARFRVIHAGIATPDIQRRMHDLRVCVDGNPPFVYWIGSWFKKYGPDRVRWSYPAKSYIENGVIQAGGSDVPVSPFSPWWGLWALVVRREQQTGEVLVPEERVTIMEALQLYTRNGAYVGFEEKKKGSLEAGKLADFIVIDRDVLTVPADEIKDVRVLQTYVGGQLVYERDKHGPPSPEATGEA